jgi:hypothetical protein
VIPVGNLYATFPSALTPPTPTITPSRTPTLTPTLAPVTYTLWSNAVPTPITNANAGGAAINLGVRFRSSVNGSITGVRFYKHSGNTGTHTGYLWTNTGTLLASATFTNETASGWQTVTFGTPVSITANTVYVAAYHSATGGFSSTANYFNTAYTNGPLTALAAATQPNGRYIYGAPGLFPNATFQNANYWVAPIFTCPSNGTGLCQAPTLTPLPTLTPTPTPAICTAGAAPNPAGGSAEPLCQPTLTPTFDCTDQARTVRLIDQSTYQGYTTSAPDAVRELQNMIVARSGGLVFLTAPTLNAIPVDPARLTVPWGATVFISKRQSFPQILPGNVTDNQIWYEVSGGSANIPIGWIAARYDGLSYLAGGNIDPCNNLVNVPVTLSFEYDRRAAANYAIEHSYDTAYNHGNLQPVGLVTQRIATIPQIPYAYFRYSDIGQVGKTGSAVFVSQSLWMGGMPMTWGQSNSCSVIPGGQPSLGWRYCFDGVNAIGDSSNPWDTHEDLISYWVSNNFNNVLRNNPNNTLGRLVTTILGRSTAESELSQFYPDVPGAIGRGNLENPTGLSPYVAQRIGQDIQRGDYLYINSNPTHGLVIIGWGSAENCPAAIFSSGVAAATTPYTLPTSTTPRGVYRNWNVNQFADTYQTALSLGIANPVPWVVDFTSPPNLSDDTNPPPYVQQTQSAVPRPFYCTLYRETTGLDFFSAHDWQFYALPNQVEVSTSTGVLHQLYVDPNWQW